MAKTIIRPHPFADLSKAALHVLIADHQKGMHVILDFDCPYCVESLEDDERLRAKRRAD
jgi:hypothetical protein